MQYHGIGTLVSRWEGGQPMEPSKIVVRYLNGKILKGTTQNFFPNKPTFHVLPLDPQKSKELMEISLSDLKAVFFVRDFLGNKLYRERKRLAPGEKPQGRLIEVTCKDGEVIVGSTTGYDPKRSGFILFPVDPKGNNIKIYILSNAVSKVRTL
jgi:hypothetical protein